MNAGYCGENPGMRREISNAVRLTDQRLIIVGTVEREGFYTVNPHFDFLSVCPQLFCAMIPLPQKFDGWTTGRDISYAEDRSLTAAEEQMDGGACFNRAAAGVPPAGTEPQTRPA